MTGLLNFSRSLAMLFATTRANYQFESSIKSTKKTSFEVFLSNGREETRTLTPKAPVPKTGASTIPPLVHKKEKLVTGFEPATY